MPTAILPNFTATADVVNEPEKGSKMISPSLEDALIILSNNDVYFRCLFFFADYLSHQKKTSGLIPPLLFLQLILYLK